MTVQQYSPSDRLRPYINSYLFIESDTARDNTVLPDTSMIMAVRYKGRICNTHGCQLPVAVISGIRDSSRFFHYDDDTANLVINFKPGAAAAFFHEPLHELYALSLAAEELKNGVGLSLLSEQLSETPEKKAQVALVEKMLLSKLIKPTPDRLINAAVQCIGSAQGNLRIADLAKELYISRDALEKRFRGLVGTSPKHFSSILRLRRAISSHTPGKSLTDTALTAGYYDQAHFIRDFRAFTGHTPRGFFSEQNFW